MSDDIRNRLAEVLKSSAHKWDTYDFDPNWDYSSESEAIADAILEAFDVTEKDAALSQPEQAEEIREAKREAWEEGVATALNYAKRGSDGITLKLVTFDGDAWRNPYSPVPVEEGESDE